MGYKADVANNGLDVLEALKGKTYDLIFMDMQMPKMDGIAATRIIRQEASQNPWIVALTANVLPEDRKLCFESGMNDFITKPIQIEHILQIFSKYSDSTR
jgi:CheY-like chemotaxis protein